MSTKILENIRKNSPEVFVENRKHLGKYSDVFKDDPEMNSFFNTFVLDNPIPSLNRPIHSLKNPISSLNSPIPSLNNPPVKS